MKIVEAGHVFELERYDGLGTERLVFVKRCDPPEKYPGNEPPAHAGTNIQEVMRALRSRLEYLQDQAWCGENRDIIEMLETSIALLEQRAHRRHGRVLGKSTWEILQAETCPICGHVFCAWCE